MKGWPKSEAFLKLWGYPKKVTFLTQQIVERRKVLRAALEIEADQFMDKLDEEAFAGWAEGSQ